MSKYNLEKINSRQVRVEVVAKDLEVAGKSIALVTNPTMKLSLKHCFGSILIFKDDYLHSKKKLGQKKFLLPRNVKLDRYEINLSGYREMNLSFFLFRRETLRVIKSNSKHSWNASIFNLPSGYACFFCTKSINMLVIL